MTARARALRARSVVIDGTLYEVHPGPDRGQWLVSRGGTHWAFVRRDHEGAWVANTVDGWVEPRLVAQIMEEAR